MDLNIKEYTEGDYEKFIFPLEKENMEAYFDKHINGGWSDEESEKYFFKVLSDRQGKAYLFEIGGEFVGHVLISNDKKENDCTFINDLEIYNKFQGKGFGTSILSFVEEKAKERQSKKIRLYVFESNPAVKLYERVGYKQIDFIAESGNRLMEKVLDSIS